MQNNAIQRKQKYYFKNDDDLWIASDNMSKAEKNKQKIKKKKELEMSRLDTLVFFFVF